MKLFIKNKNSALFITFKDKKKREREKIYKFHPHKHLIDKKIRRRKESKLEMFMRNDNILNDKKNI
jgi:hypothetical protein